MKINEKSMKTNENQWKIKGGRGGKREVEMDNGWATAVVQPRLRLGAWLRRWVAGRIGSVRGGVGRPRPEGQWQGGKGSKNPC